MLDSSLLEDLAVLEEEIEAHVGLSYELLDRPDCDRPIVYIPELDRVIVVEPRTLYLIDLATGSTQEEREEFVIQKRAYDELIAAGEFEAAHLISVRQKEQL